jgi:hypothetical protein
MSRPAQEYPADERKHDDESAGGNPAPAVMGKIAQQR